MEYLNDLSSGYMVNFPLVINDKNAIFAQNFQYPRNNLVLQVVYGQPISEKCFTQYRNPYTIQIF